MTLSEYLSACLKDNISIIPTDDRCSYNQETDTINFCMDEQYYFLCEEGYRSVLKDLGYNGNIDIKVAALLHEIGHKMTLSRFSEDEIKGYKINSVVLGFSITDEVEYFKAYHNLSIEKAADEWVVTTIKNNPEFILELSEIINAIFKELKLTEEG